MTRQEFIKLCSLFGLGISLNPGQALAHFRRAEHGASKGNLLVIGAGAGGLSAAYFAKQRGYQVKLLEASSHFGGRMKINTGFADFPIPLGAEWIETQSPIFKELVNDSSIPLEIRTIPDPPDRKFLNYSWYNFFEEYIVPSIESKINYQTVVQTIDYSSQPVKVHTNKGYFEADKVILAVPLKMLQQESIHFTPALPKPKRDALRSLEVWDGFKAFFEFSTNFYGDKEHVFDIKPRRKGQKIYYNAALGQNTNRHLLGLFVVGAPARDYISRSGEALKNFMLTELDQIYQGQASPNYRRHISQNWNQEPYIQGGYLTDHADWQLVKTLGTPVGKSLYFAGGEFTDGEDWVSVHAAARSGRRVVAML